MFNGKAIMTTYSETKMYGMTEAQIRSQYMESLTAKMSGQEMVVMGILSDCQEMLSMGAGARSVEYVRQQMNVAKFILCEMMDNKESV
jgi:predicted membrane-bound spermidine synthase